MNRLKINLIGQKFTRLTVISQAPHKGLYIAWNCLCDCGKKTVAITAHLRRGARISCGCLRTESFKKLAWKRSELSHPKEYAAWRAMKSRCLYSKHNSYGDYGGRGISVCAEWSNSFDSFLRSMGTCPKGMSLDRIDVDGDYGPGNCRWATWFEQANNRRNTIFLTFDGESLCLKDWAIKTGIKHGTIYARFKKGWSADLVLKTK